MGRRDAGGEKQGISLMIRYERVAPQVSESRQSALNGSQPQSKFGGSNPPSPSLAELGWYPGHPTIELWERAMDELGNSIAEVFSGKAGIRNPARVRGDKVRLVPIKHLKRAERGASQNPPKPRKRKRISKRKRKEIARELS